MIGGDLIFTKYGENPNMVISCATDGILKFWHLIWNLCENSIQMIYRLLWLVEI